jgi:hypothetical protein
LSSCPRSPLPAGVLARLASRLAPLAPSRPPGRGGTPPLAQALYEAKRHTHTAQGLAPSTIHGDLLGCDGGWLPRARAGGLAGPAQVRDVAGVASLLDRGIPGPGQGSRALARAGRRPQDQRPGQRRAAGVQSLAGGAARAGEQSIGHLANAWALRRWRGLLYRVRDVFRAAGALACHGRWRYRVPTR